jgi:nucleoside-diphosphate-sugar epimerase
MFRLDLLEEDGRNSMRGITTKMLDGKTVLITGASGLIGTNLLYGLSYCQRELQLRIKVVAVVQQEVPHHLQHLNAGGGVTFLCGNTADSSFLDSLPHADIIIHAATYAQPSLFTKNPVTTLKLNTIATFALLDKLLPEGKFLFASSSEVYSGLTNPPFTEGQIGTSNTSHFRSCYIEAKRCGETICNAYREGGIDAKSARISLAYGPGTRVGDKRVMHAFIERALREKKLNLLDAGVAKRTYCYVSDIVNMMWRILLEGKDAIYNIGGISTTTISDLSRLIGRRLNVPVYIPSETNLGILGAPDDVRLDLTKFINEFGPVSFIDFQTGVNRTIEWQMSNQIKEV